VASQVIQNADYTLRIILNASQSERTLSSRFLSDYFGSGVQHIAFDTSDIFATAAKLKANGVEVLRIPENYYDDLEARFGLPSDLLKQLQAGNILYDKDEIGEYFQIYTQNFENLFFFEIVERRGDYKGFGAANAPIRLAAQSRQARHPAIPRL
jgi:4-hydroxyphenylpyruvate dioxygenase